MSDERNVAISTGPGFEDLLRDPDQQFDLRSELLASILSYASAPPASAGSEPWKPAPHCVWLYAPTTTATTTARAGHGRNAGEDDRG